MTVLVVALLVAVGLLTVLVAGLLRSHAEILRQLHTLGAGREDTVLPAQPSTGPDLDVGLGVVQPGPAGTMVTGSAARAISGTTPRDEAMLVNVSPAPHDTLVAFLSSGCLTCHGFWSVMSSGGDLGLPAGTRLVVVTRGADAESPSAIAALAPATLPVVLSTQAWEDYGVPGSPYFVLVDGASGRVVGEGSATTWEQVVRLAGEGSGDRRVAHAGHVHGSVVDSGDDRHREARADRELLAAGIAPGHESLYPGGDEPAERT